MQVIDLACSRRHGWALCDDGAPYRGSDQLTHPRSGWLTGHPDRSPLRAVSTYMPHWNRSEVNRCGDLGCAWVAQCRSDEDRAAPWVGLQRRAVDGAVKAAGG